MTSRKTYLRNLDFLKRKKKDHTQHYDQTHYPLRSRMYMVSFSTCTFTPFVICRVNERRLNYLGFYGGLPI